MLTFLVTRGQRHTLEKYITDWAQDIQSQLHVVEYQNLPSQGQLEAGTYVFCDQERWYPWQRKLAIELWQQVEASKSSVVLLNDPRRVLLRYALLKKLHQRGLNDFDVYRPWNLFGKMRFPVFLHSLGGHDGPLSPLIKSRMELWYWLAYVIFRRLRRKILIEEFCDVSTDGIFTKYGAFHLNGTILPRHLFFAKNWSVKNSEIQREEEERQYQLYIDENPHASELKKIFDLAGIDFGRMDYAFHQGRLQVWEINTNPVVLDLDDKDRPIDWDFGRQFDKALKPQIQRLSELAVGDRPAPYRLSGSF